MIPRRGIRQNNPGNIRPGQGFRGETGTIDNYCVFDTAHNGIRAIGIDLLTKMERAVDTVREIVTVYAPPAENDTEAYIRDVCRRTGFKDDDILNLNHLDVLVPFVRAVVFHENGSCPYPPSVIEAACADALKSKLGVVA